MGGINRKWPAGGMQANLVCSVWFHGDFSTLSTLRWGLYIIQCPSGPTHSYWLGPDQVHFLVVAVGSSIYSPSWNSLLPPHSTDWHCGDRILIQNDSLSGLWYKFSLTCRIASLLLMKPETPASLFFHPDNTNSPCISPGSFRIYPLSLVCSKFKKLCLCVGAFSLSSHTI